MKYIFPLLCGLLLFVACQSPKNSPLGPAADYFPTTNLLRKGVVNKYYLHFTSADGYEKSTDINYYSYRLLPDDRLEITTYDAGFSLNLRLVTAFRATQQIVEEQERYWRNDTLPTTLQARVMHDWAGGSDTARLESSTDYGNDLQQNYSFRQKSRLETEYEEQAAIVFYADQEREYTFPDQEARRDTVLVRDTYLSGIGLFERQLESTKGTARLELVEQMPRKAFLKQRAAAPKRVAYINPASTLDADTDFAVCHPQRFIYDYYNGRPSGQYTGGKRALQRVFSQQFDPTLAKEASGYLTYRFVINCQGEAGRFVTEEAGLDFNRTAFSNALVQHGFEILRTLDNWQSTIINNEAVDAYAYITLKFRAGELIEILP